MSKGDSKKILLTLFGVACLYPLSASANLYTQLRDTVVPQAKVVPAVQSEIGRTARQLTAISNRYEAAGIFPHDMGDVFKNAFAGGRIQGHQPKFSQAFSRYGKSIGFETSNGFSFLVPSFERRGTLPFEKCENGPSLSDLLMHVAQIETGDAKAELEEIHFVHTPEMSASTASILYAAEYCSSDRLVYASANGEMKDLVERVRRVMGRNPKRPLGNEAVIPERLISALESVYQLQEIQVPDLETYDRFSGFDFSESGTMQDVVDMAMDYLEEVSRLLEEVSSPSMDASRSYRKTRTYLEIVAPAMLTTIESKYRTLLSIRNPEIAPSVQKFRKFRQKHNRLMDHLTEHRRVQWNDFLRGVSLHPQG